MRHADSSGCRRRCARRTADESRSQSLPADIPPRSVLFIARSNNGVTRRHRSGCLSRCRLSRRAWPANTASPVRRGICGCDSGCYSPKDRHEVTARQGIPRSEENPAFVEFVLPSVVAVPDAYRTGESAGISDGGSTSRVPGCRIFPCSARFLRTPIIIHVARAKCRRALERASPRTIRRRSSSSKSTLSGLLGCRRAARRLEAEMVGEPVGIWDLARADRVRKRCRGGSEGPSLPMVSAQSLIATKTTREAMSWPWRGHVAGAPLLK